MWHHMMDGWSGWGFLGWLFMLLFWSLIILGIIAIVRYLGGSAISQRDEKTPLDVLKERYAKGEINKKEFEDKKRDLTS
jgi:putative membrane protein